jgi:hypothetical protein
MTRRVRRKTKTEKRRLCNVSIIKGKPPLTSESNNEKLRKERKNGTKDAYDRKNKYEKLKKYTEMDDEL